MPRPSGISRSFGAFGEPIFTPYDVESGMHCEEEFQGANLFRPVPPPYVTQALLPRTNPQPGPALFKMAKGPKHPTHYRYEECSPAGSSFATPKKKRVEKAQGKEATRVVRLEPDK